MQVKITSNYDQVSVLKYVYSPYLGLKDVNSTVYLNSLQRPVFANLG